VAAKRSSGIIAGVIGLVFLLLPLLFLLPFVGNGDCFVIFTLLLNIPCIILVVQTKSLLNRSNLFAVLFISSGLLGLYLVGVRFCLGYLAYFHESGRSLELRDLIFLLLVLAPSIVAILVGVFLTKKVQESTKQIIMWFSYTRKSKERKKREKKALAWELEDQLEELKEQLNIGHITQEEYEQRKKKLEESEA